MLPPIDSPRVHRTQHLHQSPQNQRAVASPLYIRTPREILLGHTSPRSHSFTKTFHGGPWAPAQALVPKPTASMLEASRAWLAARKAQQRSILHHAAEERRQRRKRRREQRNAAATTLQRMWRSWKARQRLEELRHHLDLQRRREVECAALCVIQAHSRTKRVLNAAKIERLHRQARKQVQAALRIQKAWADTQHERMLSFADVHSKLAEQDDYLKMFREKSEIIKRTDATEVIQRHARGVVARKRVMKLSATRVTRVLHSPKAAHEPQHFTSDAPTSCGPSLLAPDILPLSLDAQNRSRKVSLDHHISEGGSPRDVSRMHKVTRKGQSRPGPEHTARKPQAQRTKRGSLTQSTPQWHPSV